MLSFLGFIENQPEIKTKTSTATMPIPCCAILPPPEPRIALHNFTIRHAKCQERRVQKQHHKHGQAS